MTYEPLHHKYRPQTFADLVGQDAIAQTLTNAILTQRIAPAYLFTGPRGTGKTSSARIFAKSLNCLSDDNPTPTPCGTCDVCVGITKGSTLDVIEIDAASNTGVDNIRELIERAQFAPVQCRYKVYVVDEVHMLSVSAFNALLKTLEEPPNRVVFILATTDPQRVLPTIISRCQRFDFRRIPLEAMVKHLQKIASQENIDITAEAIQMVAQIAQGGLRDAESLLDQLSLLVGEITVERVWDLVGAVPERDLMTLLEAIASDNATAVLECSREIMDRGREPIIVLQNLAGFYRDLLIAKAAPKNANLVALTQPTWEQLCQFSQRWDVSKILAGQKHLQVSEVQIKNTTQPRLWLEVTLLGLLPSALSLATAPQLPTQQNLSVQTAPKSSPQAQAKAPVSPAPQEKISEAKEIPPATEESEEISVISQAEMSPSVSPETANIEGEASDLHQIWQRVLAEVKPFSTQQLLNQQVSLISLKERVAILGVPNRKLQQYVTEKLANVEAAFQNVFNYPIKVKVEVINRNYYQSARDKSNSNYTKIESQKTNHEEPQETSNSDSNSDDKVVEDEPEISPAPPPTNSINSQIEKKPLPEISLPQPEWDDVESKKKYLEKERQTVAIASRRIADFFQGEIINIELIKSIKSADKTEYKTDLPATSKSPDSSMDLKDLKIDESENSNLGIDEPEENQKFEFNDDIEF